MDKNSLPPLPTVEELFAPSSSQSSSLPFIKNVNLFIPVPHLPLSSDDDMPPVPPMSSSEDYTYPYSPVPPQPTSPLVDRFDFQLGDIKASDSLLELKQNNSSEVISSQQLLSEPPCKKARLSDTAVAETALQYDSREEGEISDEDDDADQAVISGKSNTLCHKPSSAQFSAVSRSEHVLPSSNHRQVPTNSPQSLTRTSRSSGCQHQSSNVDSIGSRSHRRHRVHHSRSSLEDTRLEAGHHKKVHGASAHRTERISSRHKQAASHADGRKVSDGSKDASRSSSRRHVSSDRDAGIESTRHVVQPSSGSDGRRGSGCSHRHQSDSSTAVTESAKHESRSSHHRRHSDLSLAKGFSKEGSQMSDQQASVTHESETTAKDASETDSQHRPSLSTDQVCHGRLSNNIARSPRLHHIHPGSTLGSEIAKNVLRSSVGQQASADTSIAKSASQLLSFHSQLTDNLAADQISILPDTSNEQQSLKVSHSGTELQYSSSQQSDASKQIKPSETLDKQQSVMLELLAVMETTEKLSCQPEVGERFGKTAANCQTPNDKLVNAELLTKSCSDELRSPCIPQPAVSTAPLAMQHPSITSRAFCSQKDLDAPYSPGSLDFVDLFETSVASDVPEAVSNGDKAGSNTDPVTVPSSGLDSSTGQNGEISYANVEDSVMDIDMVDLVDELPVTVEVEEPAAIEGRGQEYEIIDDLDSNADDNDNTAAPSSENSEVEFDSGQDDHSPVKPVKAQRGQKVQKTYKASKEKLMDSVEPFNDEDGDNDFQAPLVKNKIVLRGE